MKQVLAILGLAVAFILFSVLLTGQRKLTDNPQDKEPESSVSSTTPAANTGAEPAFNAPRDGVITTELKVKNRGSATIEFYPKAAPKAVEQISALVKQGFYDGIIIHRVEKPVVAQFGNPVTKTQGVDAQETDTSVPMLKFEKNDLPHVTGAVGLARTSDKDTATSQLFIDLQRNAMWDGEYCVIGRVVKGMETIQSLERGDTIESFKVVP